MAGPTDKGNPPQAQPWDRIVATADLANPDDQALAREIVDRTAPLEDFGLGTPRFEDYRVTQDDPHEMPTVRYVYSIPFIGRRARVLRSHPLVEGRHELQGEDTPEQRLMLTYTALDASEQSRSRVENAFLQQYAATKARAAQVQSEFQAGYDQRCAAVAEALSRRREAVRITQEMQARLDAKLGT